MAFHRRNLEDSLGRLLWYKLDISSYFLFLLFSETSSIPPKNSESASKVCNRKWDFLSFLQCLFLITLTNVVFIIFWIRPLSMSRELLVVTAVYHSASKANWVPAHAQRRWNGGQYRMGTATAAFPKASKQQPYRKLQGWLSKQSHPAGSLNYRFTPPLPQLRHSQCCAWLLLRLV